MFYLDRTKLRFYLLWLSALTIPCLMPACPESHNPNDQRDGGPDGRDPFAGTEDVGHLSPRPPPAGLSDISFSLSDSYRVGDTMRIDVIADNRSSSTIEGQLELTIGLDHMASMIFPDKEIPVNSASVSIPPNSSEVYSFEYTLPVDIFDTDDYCVIASIEYNDPELGYDRGLEGFDVEAFYRAELAIPDDLHECEDDQDCRFDLGLFVENTSPEVVETVACELELPFGVQTLDGGKQLVLIQDELEPYEAVTKTVELKIVEFSEAANFVVTISSDNGGSTRVSKTVGITPLEHY